jgi:hypothetical protein
MVNEEIYSQLSQAIGTDNVSKFVALTGIQSNYAVLIIAVLLITILIWSLVWKALALYKSARNGHKFWFVLMFVLLIYPTITLGILEILYIYLFSKMDFNNPQSKSQKNNKNKGIKKKKTR